MKGKRSKLHETPPEFQKAREAQAARLAWEQRACGCRIRKLEEEARREALRNMKMPAHLPPCPARIVGYEKGRPIYESRAEVQQRRIRLAHRRAHKKFI